MLCLQEVDRDQRRSGGVDQTAVIAEGLGAVSWRFEPALVGEPGATWRSAADAGAETEPGYGVALVSRLPVRSWHVIRLAAAAVRAPVAVPGGRGRFIWLRDEPRVGLVAVIDGPAGDLAVATTHLSFVPGWNALQLLRLTRALAPLAPAAILGGDLNLPGPPVRMLAGAGGWRPLIRSATFPGARPSMQIDHVLARGDVGTVTATSTRALALSDHLAVTVDLAWDEPGEARIAAGDGRTGKM